MEPWHNEHCSAKLLHQVQSYIAHPREYLSSERQKTMDQTTGFTTKSFTTPLFPWQKNPSRPPKTAASEISPPKDGHTYSQKPDGHPNTAHIHIHRFHRTCKLTSATKGCVAHPHGIPQHNSKAINSHLVIVQGALSTFLAIAISP